MVRIRLRRTGKKKQPSYRVVVADSRSPRDGKFIEIIGHYHPVLQPKELVIKNERARYWLGVGAQPSDTVTKLLKQVNVLDTEGNVTSADVDVVEPVAAAPAAKPAKAKASVKAKAPAKVDSTPAAPVAEAMAAPEPVAAAEPVAAKPVAAEAVIVAAETDEPAPAASE